MAMARNEIAILPARCRLGMAALDISFLFTEFNTLSSMHVDLYLHKALFTSCPTKNTAVKFVPNLYFSLESLFTTSIIPNNNS